MRVSACLAAMRFAWPCFSRALSMPTLATIRLPSAAASLAHGMHARAGVGRDPCREGARKLAVAQLDQHVASKFVKPVLRITAGPLRPMLFDTTRPRVSSSMTAILSFVARCAA